MRRGVVLLALNQLRAHEQVCPQRLAVVKAMILKAGRINNPVIVDRKTKIILDGHHRVASLRQLNYRLVPAMEVDYFSNQARVYSRRKNFIIMKAIVVQTVLKNMIYPQKTTRHLIKNRIRGVNFKLNQLK